jgi:hypothetical protein
MAVTGRIAYGCDGNLHDSDDILASALTLALLSKNGLAGQLAHYHYNGHFWGDSSLEVVPNQEARMTVSSLATPNFWSGFNMANFFDARAQTATVISHLTGLINASTASDPLWLIAAGPMEIIGRAVNASNPSARQHVYLISHSAGFNDFHAQDAIDTQEVGWEQLQGWTYPEVVALGVNGIHIANQNNVLNAPHSEYFWLRDSPDVALRWVWARSQDPAPAEFSSYGPGSGYIWQPVVFDASDAGMVYWLITGGINGGDEAGSPAKLQANLTLADTLPNHAPVATINNHSLHTNQWSQVASLMSYSDADGNPAIQYQFWDGGTASTSGYFWTPSNDHNPANTAITVAASDLNNVWLRGGQTGGSETMWVRAFDGTDWSAWDSFTLTTLA